MKRLITSFILSAILMALAVFLLLYPEKTVSIIFVMVAFFILVSALRELYAILSVEQFSGKARIFGIIKNVINLVFSAVLIYLSFNNPGEMMNIIVYLIAIDLLLTALSDALDYYLLYRLGYRGVPIFDLLLRIVLSIVMFFFPTFISSTFITVVAIILIVVSVSYFLLSIFSLKKVKKSEEIVVEYEQKD